MFDLLKIDLSILFFLLSYPDHVPVITGFAADLDFLFVAMGLVMNS
jgi:hypothetical protein